MAEITPDENIVIFRNGSIGNTLVAVPLIRSIKKSAPQCRISAIVDTVGRELMKRCPYIDELIVYDKRGIHKPLMKTIGFIRDLKKKRFSKAILLKRFFRNEAIAYFAGIPGRFGYSSPGVAPFELTATIPYVEGKNIIDLNNDILKLFNIESSGDELQLWFSASDEEKANKFIDDNRIGEYVVFHPGGQTIGGKGLGTAGFVQIGKEIIDRYKYNLVIIGETGETDAVNTILKRMDEYAFSAVGLPILIAAQLIKRAKLFIGNDSGPSHIADAVGTPGIIIYPPSKGKIKTHIDKWKPKGENYIAVEIEGGEKQSIGRISERLDRFLK